jgi:hypothetical protein
VAREILARAPASPSVPGLAGAVGDALFACVLGRAEPGIDIDFWFARAIHAVNARRPGPSLHRGVAGLGFVIATYSDAQEELLCAIDQMLVGRLSGLPCASLQSGVAGIALYASLRSHAATGRTLQRAALAALAAAATPSDGGLLWHTPESYARARDVQVRGESITEFGMAHGIGGALVGLSALAKRGYAEAADLARAGLRALWEWEGARPNRFGRISFGPKGRAGTVELGGGTWCAGDPGALRACWIAAQAIGDTISAAGALSRLRETAQRDVEGALTRATGRIDLCCGSSAVAQVYLRMHRETDEPLFRAAHERLLAECARDVARLTASSFQYGRAGVLLALLAAETSKTPVWDSILGISLPLAAREGEG